jgi:hypothetical protein
VGQDLTIEVVKRGDFGIKFLARVYSAGVWEGNSASCCDIKRQLAKFHVTVNLASGITPAMKMLEKVRCFLLTDSNTPIIGDFCRVARFLHGNTDIKADERLKAISRWKSSLPLENQYDNEAGDWMIEYAQKDLPDFDYSRFKEWLNRVPTLEAMLSPPMFLEPPEAKPTKPVVFEDQVLIPNVPEVKSSGSERKVNRSDPDSKTVIPLPGGILPGVLVSGPVVVTPTIAVITGIDATKQSARVSNTIKKARRRERARLLRLANRNKTVPEDLKHKPTMIPLVEKGLKTIVQNMPTPDLKGLKVRKALHTVTKWQVRAKSKPKIYPDRPE